MRRGQRRRDLLPLSAAVTYAAASVIVNWTVCAAIELAGSDEPSLATQLAFMLALQLALLAADGRRWA